MASQTTKIDIEAAIAVVEQSKDTHSRWISHIRRGKISSLKQCIGGTRTFHEGCVREYLHVLAVLKGLDKSR